MSRCCIRLNYGTVLKTPSLFFVSYYEAAQEAGSKFAPCPIVQFDPTPTQSQTQPQYFHFNRHDVGVPCEVVRKNIQPFVAIQTF